ncbi:MAG: hypothetical protein AAF614_02735 [Chloroflexota bacterium]
MMQTIFTEKRWLLTAVFLLFSLIACAALSLTLTLINTRQSTDYPGALQLSEHIDFGLIPTPFYRQDSSYRTNDIFPEVANWYQQQFGLGPEAAAQSSCSHLYSTTSRFIVRQQASVTICDSENGRLVFVQRVVSLDLN